MGPRDRFRSAYLIRQRHSRDRQYKLLPRITNAQALSRIAVALALWTSLAFLFNLAGVRQKPLASQITSNNHPKYTLQATPAPGTLARRLNPTPAPAAPGPSLPAGPTGKLFPATANLTIMVASDRSYPNSYAWGQCTWYVASRRHVPSNWGNAKTWYPRAQTADWPVGTLPAIGAIAWTPNGWAGHVALVEQITADGSSVMISEMNWRAVGVKTIRWVPTSDFKYIYQP